MASTDYFGQLAPTMCYLYEDKLSKPIEETALTEYFQFQYWPASLSIQYSPNYNEIMIPGADRPLYQWISGGARTISFQAILTAEVNVYDPLQIQLTGSSTLNPFMPSTRYTVDVAAGLAKLQSYTMPFYGATQQSLNSVVAPPRLMLVMPNTALAGGTTNSKASFLSSATRSSKDALPVILKNLSISIESWFQDGTPKIATVDLQFVEHIQINNTVSYRGNADYSSFGDGYEFKGNLV